VFTWVEGKVRSPLAPLRIFRVGQVRGANIAMLMVAAAMVGFFFIFTLYLQDILGYSAIKAGMASVPLGAILIIGAGLGLAFIALTIASVSGIEAEHSGVAGGLINMTQQVGGAIGLAVITAIITTHVHSHGPGLDSFTGGLRDALTAAAIIGAASLAVSAIALPRRHRDAPTPEIAETAQVPAHDPA
jgi:MFS family permease